MASSGDADDDPYHSRCLQGKSEDEKLLLTEPVSLRIFGESPILAKPAQLKDAVVLYAKSPVSYFDQPTYLAFARRPSGMVTSTEALKNVVAAGDPIKVSNSRVNYLLVGIFGEDELTGPMVLLFHRGNGTYVVRNLRQIQIPRRDAPVLDTSQLKKDIERLKMGLSAYLLKQDKEVRDRLEVSDTSDDEQNENLQGTPDSQRIQRTMTTEEDGDDGHGESRNHTRPTPTITRRSSRLEQNAQQELAAAEEMKSRAVVAAAAKAAADKAKAAKAAATKAAAANAAAAVAAENEKKEKRRLYQQNWRMKRTKTNSPEPVDDTTADENTQDPTTLNEVYAMVKAQQVRSDALADQITQLKQEKGELAVTLASARNALANEKKLREDAENELMMKNTPELTSSGLGNPRMMSVATQPTHPPSTVVTPSPHLKVDPNEISSIRSALGEALQVYSF